MTATEALAEYMTHSSGEKVKVIKPSLKKNVTETLNEVLSTKQDDELVLVCGSFFIMTPVK